MLGQPISLKSLWRIVRHPVDTEKLAILDARWREIPQVLRDYPMQGFGRQSTGCGATIGINPRCDFSCTGCYLGKEANQIPNMPLAGVLAQLDALRAHLGPKANVQITDGEVTLRPIEELLAVLRHARAIGIIPMVMTHGDRLRLEPGLLERLMVEGGLTEISIHVDITMRGRDGYPVPKSELELLPLRDEFAALIRTARKRTGLPLRAATTMTITEQNLPDVAAVVRWLIRNRDTFGLISFQPLAMVGRTRKELHGVTPQSLWDEVNKATRDFGLDLPNETGPIHFGHEDCTRVVPLIGYTAGDRPVKLMQLLRSAPEDVEFYAGYSANRLSGMNYRDDRWLERKARTLGLFLKAPRWAVGPARRWLMLRVQSELGFGLTRLIARLVTGRGRLEALTLTSHHFMNPDEAATPLGQERLAACVFKLPVNGEMVPMCKMNAGGARESFYQQMLAQPAGQAMPLPVLEGTGQ